ncbi:MULTISPECIES: hypothetical protein [Cytobacillus]|jgi:hypothetical protein|uniref:Coat F domain-containing protein n=4 Tax=Cytobacillus TaxID=2675230 RepID=A0A1S1YLJ9_9BACI|nr:MULTISPECIES: hypothetical protein [Cytobacillus]EFV78563.1 hypothetical protein HMPREF1013_01201 [Bacillus sp. 2_A_57_CT2]AND42072.1 hypothetical protein A361_23970 [Cytobacillus oceanisediminis 2691]MBU8730925.1 hypothetical protein [Cytobacillus oceanisediminis]MBY0159091.1 hypothetical protein [Cytobacillus firmus]MCM3244385.1 hypothetical protein [Cytobacillus oceanisediminis]
MQQQNMNMQNQQGIMQQPPAVISTKDALYLTDMLTWNLLACKKAHFYAQQCQDQELKTHFEQCGQMHQRHYEQLLAHLNQQNQQNFMGMQ